MIKQLIRTNPALTSNYKFVITSNDLMYLESYDANYNLANIKYKHFLVPTNSWLSERLSTFYNGLSKEIAFDIASINNSNNYEKNYKSQFNDIYWAGCKNVEDNFYIENKEYIAPLLIDGDELPSYFLIYRIDNTPFQDSLTDNTNFYDRKIKNMTLVYSYDMTNNTNFGSFLKRNILDNTDFPKEPLNINVNKNEFTYWKGINYSNGGFISSALFCDEVFNADSIHSDIEEFLTNGFKTTGTICSNILNFKFLFNDYKTKLTPLNLLEKIDFSINEYLGFYSKEKIKIKSYSPYITYEFNKNFYIVDNVFRPLSNVPSALIPNESKNPLNINWPSEKVFIKINDEFKEVIYNNNEYKIIDNKINNIKVSDIISDPAALIKNVENTVNDSLCYFLSTPGFKFPFKYEGLDSDFLTIEINNKLYSCKPNVIDNNNNNISINGFYIYTDDYIYSDNNSTIINNLNNNLIIKNNLLNNKPIEFILYYHSMVEMHDLDFNYKNTDYANYEYELSNNLTKSEQPKLQSDLDINLKYKLNINNLDISINDTDNINLIKESDIPYSSEYAIGKDLYLNSVKKLWNENAWITKWGAIGSIGHSDYPYKFNIANKISGYNNLEPNANIKYPNEKYCNLDWFYIIGEPRLETITIDNINLLNINNPDRYILQKFLYHSLHISPINIDYINRTNDNLFWVNQYFDINSHLNTKEYFDTFFNNDYLNNTQDKKSVTKYSTFRNGDDTNAPYTIFKGLKYNLWIKKNNKLIIDNNLNNLKFSVVLTKRPTEIVSDFGKCGGTITISKKSKSVVLSVWFYVPYNSLTSIENVFRKNLYKGTVIYNNITMDEQVIDNYCYDLDKTDISYDHSKLKRSNLTPTHLTLSNIVNYINGDLVGFDYNLEYLSDDNNEYYITVQKPDEFIIDNLSYSIVESTNNVSIFNKIKENDTIKCLDNTIYTPYVNQNLEYKYSKINRTDDEIYNLNTSSKIERFSCGYMPITKKIDVFSDKNIKYVYPQFTNNDCDLILDYDSSTFINNIGKGYLTLVKNNNITDYVKKNMSLNIDSIANYTYNNLTINNNMNLKPIWCKNKTYNIIDVNYNIVENKTYIKLELVNIELVSYKINNEDHIKISGKPITTNLKSLLNTYIIDNTNTVINTYFKTSTDIEYTHNIDDTSNVYGGDILNTYNFIVTIFNNSNNDKFWCDRPEIFKSINTNNYIYGNKNFAKVEILANKILDNFYAKNIEPNLPIINEIKNDYTTFNIFSNLYEVGFFKNTINNNYIN